MPDALRYASARPDGIGVDPFLECIRDAYTKAGQNHWKLKTIHWKAGGALRFGYLAPDGADLVDPFTAVREVADLKVYPAGPEEVPMKILLTCRRALRELGATYQWILAPSEAAADTWLFPKRTFSMADAGLDVVEDPAATGVFLIGSDTGDSPVDARWGVRLWQEPG